MQLKNLRTVVTGSSQGIGLAIAQAYAKEGAKVCLNSQIAQSECIEVQELQKQFPGHIYYVQANLTKEGEADALIAAAWREFGGVDVVVNNLGTYREPAFLELTKADFDRILTMNVWTALATSQAFVSKAQQANLGGRILFTTSLNGSRSEPGHTLYDASKGAMDALVRQLAIELAPLGFTTAAVAPGLVETPLTDYGLKSDPAARQTIIDQIPLRKIATVDDIAGWFVFLASAASRYATGTIIPVDGGLNAQQMSVRPLSGGTNSA